MIYNDKVYGPVKIEENFLIELMNSKPMQRLKDISQAGSIIFLSPTHKSKVFKSTRYEHSIGVFLLLKLFNASIEEQIAGLIHDSSHTVFSHSLDFLFNRNVQHDYHEEFKERIIMNSEIPEILQRNGIDVKNILDEKKFGLLEKELPDLCADRIDYFFRDYELYGVSNQELKTMLNGLMAYEGEFIFMGIDAAKSFAEKYIKANKLFWCNALQATEFKLISDVVKMGMEKGLVSDDDLFSTDKKVYEKLKNSGDREIERSLNLIYNLQIIEDENDYDFHVKSKVRFTDPKVLIYDSVSRLSELDESYKRKMEEFIAEYSKGFFVKIKI